MIESDEDPAGGHNVSDYLCPIKPWQNLCWSILKYGQNRQDGQGDDHYDASISNKWGAAHAEKTNIIRGGLFLLYVL